MKLLIVAAPVLFWFLGNSRRVEHRNDKDDWCWNFTCVPSRHQSSGYWRSKVLIVTASFGSNRGVWIVILNIALYVVPVH